MSWLRAFQLGTRYHARPSYDTAAQEPWFSYTAAGHRHVVWFENQASSRAKFEAASGSGAGGIFLMDVRLRGHQDLGRAARRAARAGQGPVIPWWGLAVGVLGVNFALWGLASLCRLAGTMPRPGRARSAPAALHARLTVKDVAVLIPAHNEAVVIGDTLTAIMALAPRANVHVVSSVRSARSSERPWSDSCPLVRHRLRPVTPRCGRCPPRCPGAQVHQPDAHGCRADLLTSAAQVRITPPAEVMAKISSPGAPSAPRPARRGRR